MPGILNPNTYTQINGPLIFLAGPIGCAPNWQDKAIEIIMKEEPNITIISPRPVNNNLKDYLIEGDNNKFYRQRAWELHYLNLASKNGCIMFWLPGEEKHKCNKVYGAMTRIELGEAIAFYKMNNDYHFCVGSDNEFPEIKTIRYDLSILAPDKNQFQKYTLKDTCLEAIKIAKQ